MGKERLVDKTIRPQDVVKALMAGDITFAQAQQMYEGAIVIGDYKGTAAALDIDLLVKQPLVWAEQQHILGILDGREEDYDLQTLAITAAEAIGTIHDASLVVPAGEVWFLNAIRMTVPASVGAVMTVNCQWYCDLWPDHAGTAPSGYGQAFYAAAQNLGIGLQTYTAEFAQIPVAFAVTNKVPVLRLPAGTKLTCRFLSLLATEAASCTFQLFGFIGKPLVD